MTTRYAFLDIETPGLVTNGNHILEIAWFVTNERLEQLTPDRSFVVEHDHESWQEIFGLLRDTPFIKEMHEKSGLLVALGAHGTLIEDVFEAFIDDVLGSIPPTLIPDPDDVLDVALAGYSIHFDAEWMKASAFEPLFTSDVLGFQISHRHLDLSAFKRMYKDAGLHLPAITNLNPHRALFDAHEAHDFARKIRTDLAFMRNGIESALR